MRRWLDGWQQLSICWCRSGAKSSESHFNRRSIASITAEFAFDAKFHRCRMILQIRFQRKYSHVLQLLFSDFPKPANVGSATIGHCRGGLYYCWRRNCGLMFKRRHLRQISRTRRPRSPIWMWRLGERFDWN